MSASLPRISIIMPSYNQAAYLERAMSSVLDQDYPNLEYLVIDGGSSDGSVEIIRRHSHRLAYWCSEKDRGQTHALNKGLARATGDIVAFLNSDDLYVPGALASVAKLMTGPDAPRWLVGGCLQVDAQDRIMGCFAHAAPRSLGSYLMRSSGMIPQPSSFWSAKLVSRLGGFDPDLHYCFDYEFNCRLLATGETPLLIDQPLASFRFHDASKSGTQAMSFGLERIIVARHYARVLPWRQRLELWRNIGYRQRCYSVEGARAKGKGLLWRRVLCRPWWLASSDIRRALVL